jgi:hypothetical protein
MTYWTYKSVHHNRVYVKHPSSFQPSLTVLANQKNREIVIVERKLFLKTQSKMLRPFFSPFLIYSNLRRI